MDAVEACWVGTCSDVDTPIDDPPAWLESVGEAEQPWQCDDEFLLVQTAWAAQALAAAHAHYLALLAEVDRRGATERVHGMPAASWLAAGPSHSARAAKADVRLAGLMAGLPPVSEALASGAVSVEQAAVICHGLALVDDLDVVQRNEVAAHLVQLGAEFGPVALRRLVNRAVEVVAPEVVDERDQRALERAEQRAAKDRYLAWRRDHDGGLLLRGKLPAAEGDLLVGHLTALADQQRAADAVAGVETSRGQALADALVLAVGHHATCVGGPARGGDQARVIVTIDLEQLRSGVGGATLLGSGEQVTAGQARRIACSAGILPVVLGGESLPLDVGRERRLFTAAQRAALAVRDRGCAFPGCDRPPSDCEVHHRAVPWRDGGPTDLENGVLLCPHHHHLVEPDPRRPDDRNWRIDLDARGRPVFTAPANRSGQRITRQHARYRL